MLDNIIGSHNLKIWCDSKHIYIYIWDRLPICNKSHFLYSIDVEVRLPRGI